MQKLKYPQYFEVDGTYVKVDYDEKTDEVFGKTKSGKDYSPYKCIVEGHVIKEEAFNKA